MRWSKVIFLLVVGAIFCFFTTQRGGAQEDPIKSYRALITYGRDAPAGANDATELKEALIAGGWDENRIWLRPIPNDALLLSGLMRTVFGEPGADSSLKLFYYSGEGTNAVPAAGEQLDEPEQNRSYGKLETKIRGGGEITDDELGAIWAGYTGKKVLIFETCNSGEMFDGANDPGRIDDSYTMASSQRDQRSQHRVRVSVAHLHRHGDFTVHLLAGLGGAADRDPTDGKITFKELFDYADQQTFNEYRKQNPEDFFFGDTPPVDDPIVNVPAGPGRPAGEGSDEGDECASAIGGVGGIAELPEIAKLPLEAEESSETNYAPHIATAIVIGMIIIVTGIHYLRRRKA